LQLQKLSFASYLYAAGGTNATDRYITSLSTTNAMHNISYSNNAYPANGYGFFTSDSIIAGQGTSFTLNMTNTTNTRWSRVNVYADWNGNKNFTDAGETVLSVGNASQDNRTRVLNISNSIAVPATATLGITRMRVRFYDAWNTDPGPCGLVDFTTTQDFIINVSAPSSANCPGTYDNVSNETFGNANQIPLNTDISGKINPKRDKDYYKFTITTSGTITISLTTLPADYNLTLYNGSQAQVGISQNGGITGETINYTAAAGTYYVLVSGANNNVGDANNCYTLNVTTGTASRYMTPSATVDLNGKEKVVEIYPNPVKNMLDINLSGYDGSSQVQVYDIQGRILLQQVFTNGRTTLNIASLITGVYLVKIRNKEEETVVKLIKE